MLRTAFCAPAEAQNAIAPAKPAGQVAPAVPVTPMPEVPAGPWDDSIIKEAKTQSYDGQEHAAIEFERLQAHLDSIWHYDKAASILGKPIATIAGFRQNMGWPALVDGR